MHRTQKPRGPHQHGVARPRPNIEGCESEVGINHFPRTAGQQTGANLKVILRASRSYSNCARHSCGSPAEKRGECLIVCSSFRPDQITQRSRIVAIRGARAQSEYSHRIDSGAGYVQAPTAIPRGPFAKRCQRNRNLRRPSEIRFDDGMPRSGARPGPLPADSRVRPMPFQICPCRLI